MGIQRALWVVSVLLPYSLHITVDCWTRSLQFKLRFISIHLLLY